MPKVLLFLIALVLIPELITCTRKANNIDYSARPTAEDFRLLDQNGKSFQLSNFAGTKAIVLITQTNGCPLIRKYFSLLNELRDKYSASGVTFLFLNSNIQDDLESLGREASQYNLTIPILKDDAQLVARSLHVTRSGEVFVIIPKIWKIAYHGAIDDRLDYSAEKEHANKNYLIDAIESILHQRPVPVSDTDAKGCHVTFQTYPELTFKDIAPILREHCLPCHAPGRVAPTNMSTYNEIRGWAAMIREVVMQKRMPPWPADPRFGRFREENILRPEEASRLLQWIDSGAPIGAAKEPSRIDPPPDNAVAMGAPDITLRLNETETLPAQGLIPWKYYQYGDLTKNDIFVRSIRIADARNRHAIHHFSLLLLKRPVATYKNGEMWSAADQNIVVLGGTGKRFDFPAGVAFEIPKGVYIGLQAHYEATGKPETVEPVIELWLSRKGEQVKPAHFGYLVNGKLLIPPGGHRTISIKADIPRDIHLLQVNYHMHLRGRATRMLVRDPSGKTETLFSIPDFNEHFEQTFTYIEPKLVRAGSQIEAIADYDNSKENPRNPDPTHEVHEGEQLTTDEMLKQSYLYY